MSLAEREGAQGAWRGLRLVGPGSVRASPHSPSRLRASQPVFEAGCLGAATVRYFHNINDCFPPGLVPFLGALADSSAGSPASERFVPGPQAFAF